MKLFSEKVNFTLTNSSHNILQVESFEEIFFGVYEIEINKSKYPVEKISEHSGNPVVSVPVEVKGERKHYPFILIQGNPEVLFNEHNTIDKIVNDFEEPPKILVEEPDQRINIPVIYDDPINIPLPVDNKTQILEQIKRAKKEASLYASKIKRDKIDEANLEIASKKKALDDMVIDARSSLVKEFINVSNNIKNEFINENDNRFNEIKETIDNKIQDMSDSLWESLKKDFSTSEKQFDSKIKELIKELYESLQPKIDDELKSIATEIVEKVDSIEKTLDEKLKDKADKSLIENVEGELNSIASANVELNDKINKGVNRALSRVGNIDKRVDDLTIAISEEVNARINEAETYITTYYKDKIELLENKAFDLNEETRKYFIELITESRNNLIDEVRTLKNEKPIEYIIESKGKKETIKSDDLIKDFDKKITSKIDTEVTRLRKYISVYSGGGSVAMQFADGGTMNGNLTVVGSISASQYLGMTGGGDYLSLSGGVVSGDIEAQSFITTGGLSSQFVKGDGSLDPNTYITAEKLSSSLTLYPTSTASDISGYYSIVTTPLDPNYDEPAVDIPTGPISGTNQLIASLATDSGVVVGDLGIFNATTIGNIRKVGGSGSSRAVFHFEIYKRDSLGNEELISTSSNTAESNESFYVQFFASAVFNDGVFLSSDRVVIKFYATKTAGGASDPAYEFQFGGITPVRILLPVPVEALLDDYIPYTGATKNLDLGSHSLSTNGTISIGGNQVATVVDPMRTTLSGDGILSAFTINGADNLLNPSALIVAIDGAMQEPVQDYTVASGVITFTSPIPNGSKAVVISPTNTLQVSQMIPADGSVTSEKLDTDIEIVGQLTAPNQTAVASDSVMTIKLLELVSLQQRVRQIIYQNTFGQTFAVGSGSIYNSNAGTIFLRTGTTPSSRMGTNSGGNTALIPQNSVAGDSSGVINFSRKQSLFVKFSTSASADCTGRIYWGGTFNSVYAGDPTAKSIGIKIHGNNVHVFAVSNGGVYTESSALTTVTANLINEFAVISDGSGNVSLYQGSTLIGSITGGPTGVTFAPSYATAGATINNNATSLDANLVLISVAIMSGELF